MPAVTILTIRVSVYNISSGCGHCKKAKPEFMAAAARFKDDGKVGLIGKVCNLPLTRISYFYIWIKGDVEEHQYNSHNTTQDISWL